MLGLENWGKVALAHAEKITKEKGFSKEKINQISQEMLKAIGKSMKKLKRIDENRKGKNIRG